MSVPDAAPEEPPQTGQPDWTDPNVPLGAGIDFADPNSPLAPFYLSVAQVLAVGLVAAAAVLVARSPLFHTDIWGHLAYGRYIVEHRELADREPLNPYTDQSVPLFHSMWLTQAGYYLVYEAGAKLAGGDAVRRMEGGVEAVTAAHALVVAAALAMFTLAYQRASGSMGLAVLGLLLLVVAIVGALSVQRPQAVGILCFAAVLAGVLRPVPSRRALLLVPLVFAFWSNAHGSFVVGLAVIGLRLAGRVVEAARVDAGWSVGAAVRDPAARRLVWLLGLSAVAVMLNPYGPGVYQKVVAFSGHPVLATFNEWLPMNFSNPTGGHWAYLAAVLLLIAVQAASPRPLSPTEMLLLVTFGVWPLVQQRQWVWWAALLPCVLLPHLAAATARRSADRPAEPPSFRMTLAAAALVLFAAAFTPAARWAKTGSPRPAAASTSPGTPTDVAAAMYGVPGRVSNRFDAVAPLAKLPPGSVVFSSETVGDFLVWAAPPGTPLMMFAHGHLFPPAYWAECRAVKMADPGWWDVLDRYRANAIVVDAGNHPDLIAAVRKRPDDWAVLLDEPPPPDGREHPTDRLFVAVRKSPFPAAGGPR